MSTVYQDISFMDKALEEKAITLTSQFQVNLKYGLFYARKIFAFLDLVSSKIYWFGISWILSGMETLPGLLTSEFCDLC